MLSNKYLSLIIALIITSSLAAFSITDDYFGKPYQSLDGRSAAMGGAGVFNALRPAAFTENPANLTLQKGCAGLQAGLLINRAEDIRMMPLYNSFDNYIDDAVYASNINFYTNFAAAAYYKLNIKDFGFGLGGYHTPLYSFDGNYREEIRNNRNTDNDGYPEKIAQNDIENSGNLNKSGLAFSVAYAFDDYWNLNLGVDFGLLRADVEQLKTIKWSDWAKAQMPADKNLPEYSHQVEYDLKGTELKLGAALRVGPHWGLGFSFQPQNSLTRKGTDHEYREAYLNNTVAADSTFSSFDEKREYPGRLKMGLAYFPQNLTRTVMNMDFERVDYKGVHEELEPAYNFYVGVEHHILYRMPLRLGFQAVNSYLMEFGEDYNEDNQLVSTLYPRRILTPMITGGSTVPIASNINLDLGFGYGWRDYEAKDLFGDGYYNDKTYTGGSYVLWPNSYIKLTDRGWDNPDKVKENYINLSASISVSW